MYKIDKDNIKTDNIPLVDELVYAIKKICKTCVLKDEAKALECESLETQKESDIYLLCVVDLNFNNLFKFLTIDI